MSTHCHALPWSFRPGFWGSPWFQAKLRHRKVVSPRKLCKLLSWTCLSYVSCCLEHVFGVPRILHMGLDLCFCKHFKWLKSRSWKLIQTVLRVACCESRHRVTSSYILQMASRKLVQNQTFGDRKGFMKHGRVVPANHRTKAPKHDGYQPVHITGSFQTWQTGQLPQLPRHGKKIGCSHAQHQEWQRAPQHPPKLPAGHPKDPQTFHQALQAVHPA